MEKPVAEMLRQIIGILFFFSISANYQKVFDGIVICKLRENIGRKFIGELKHKLAILFLAKLGLQLQLTDISAIFP